MRRPRVDRFRGRPTRLHNEFTASVFLPLTGRGPVTISPAAPTGRRESDISVALGSQSRSRAQAGECPERQRGRTVNPLAMPSQVRVLLPPPPFSRAFDFPLFVAMISASDEEGRGRRSFSVPANRSAAARVNRAGEPRNCAPDRHRRRACRSALPPARPCGRASGPSPVPPCRRRPPQHPRP